MRVLLFGPQAAALGADHLDLAVAPPCTCGSLRDAIHAAAPMLRLTLPAARFAVNHAFAHDSHVVSERDEIALIALVSGG